MEKDVIRKAFWVTLASMVLNVAMVIVIDHEHMQAVKMERLYDTLTEELKDKQYEIDSLTTENNEFRAYIFNDNRLLDSY